MFTSLRFALALAILAGKDLFELFVVVKVIVVVFGSVGSVSEELDDVVSVGVGVWDGV